MPMQWTPIAMERLYLAILKTSDGLRYDANEIVKYMGPNCTARAVSHRVSIIKNEIKEMVTEWDGVTSIATSTPKKRKQSSQDEKGIEHEPKVATPASKKTRTKITPVKEEPIIIDDDESATKEEESNVKDEESSVKEEESNVKEEDEGRTPVKEECL